MSERVNLTDDEILAVLWRSPGNATYVYRNMLSMAWHVKNPKFVKTASVLTRLKRLERQGKVRQVRSNYAVMLCWEPAP